MEQAAGKESEGSLFAGDEGVDSTPSFQRAARSLEGNILK
jgi:hypothetical protein